MSEKNTLGAEHAMSWETTQEHSPADVHQSLMGLLDSSEEQPDADREQPSDAVEQFVDDFEDADDSEDYEEDVEESDEDEDADDDEEEPGDTYTVTVDGEEKRVTLDELRSGFMLQADYTRKRQAEKRETESAIARAAEVREQYVAGLDQLERALMQITPQRDASYWEGLRKSNPAEYAAQWAESQAQQQQLQAVQAEQARVMREQWSQTVSREGERLLDAIPEWRDETVARSEKDALAEHAKSTYGFTEQELGGVTDHRLMLVLRDAMRWHKQQSTTQGATEKIRKKAKKARTLPPGGRPRTRRAPGRKQTQRALQRATETGRSSDAAVALEFLLPEDP